MILVLTGPTGSGKSQLAVSLAKKLGAVILNADAFQVYQELNLCTAKPSLAMRQEVPHELFDFVPLSEDYSVFAYQHDLRAKIEEYQAKNIPMIIAGGTGLYVRAALYDYEFPEEKDVDMSSYEALGEEELYAALMALDPETAKAVHPHNRVRVLRSLRVCLSSGKKKSEILSSQKHKVIYPDVHFYTLASERESLYERVERRVDEMVEEGMVEENRVLYEKYGDAPHAFKAIGFKELIPYFHEEAPLEDCLAAIKANTRHYIKRQETFFRHQFDAKWVREEREILEDLGI